MSDAKSEQGYDPDPPRCFACVYFRHEKPKFYVERTVRQRSGKVKTITVRNSKRERLSAYITRCTFGDFDTTGRGVCDKWHSRSGETIEDETTP